MLELVQFFKGYLSIQVQGYSTERFINLCGIHNILLWDIENHGDFYSMKISLMGFYQIKSITRKTGTKVVVTNRFGLPFLWKKIWRRKLFLIGLCISIGFLIVSSQFIWRIEITGNHTLTEENITDFLETQNIRRGTGKKELQLAELKKELRNHFSEITWVSAKLKGTRLMISIKENELLTKQTDKEDSETGYDLVADCDGMICSIVTRKGVPLVKEGDLVALGDVLVEGSIPIYAEDGTKKAVNLCRADADILIQRVVPIKESTKDTYLARTYSGKESKAIQLLIGTFHTLFIGPPNSLKTCDSITEWKQPELFTSLHIPVWVLVKRSREYSEKEEAYTKEEIRRILEQKVQKFLQSLDEKGVQIVEKNVTIKKYKGLWTLEGTCTIKSTASISIRETEVEQEQNQQ